MDAEFFARSVATVRDAFARGLGCTPDAFSTERLTIVDRTVAPAWPYTALLATFGTGTVLSIDPAYRGFAEAHSPDHHYQAMAPEFVHPLVEEGRKRGVRMEAQSPGLGFALGAPLDAPAPPPGLSLKVVDAGWMQEEMPRRRFENGVGRPGVNGRQSRNQFACVLFDGESQPAAVAGAFLTFGLYEIGVDVLHGYRGKGLAPIVVRAAAAAILARDQAPFYGCAATNIRSQRTALASGFLPVCSDAAVTPVSP
jgi:hypothetical protein